MFHVEQNDAAASRPDAISSTRGCTVASHGFTLLGLDGAMSSLESTTEFKAAPGEAARLTGAILVLIQFDVCEEIYLDQLQQIIASRTVQQPSLKNAAPAYVRYQRPPVVVAADPLVLDSGEQLTGEIKYYDYGVVSIVYQLPFAGDWDSLVRLSSRWVWDIDFASRAEPMIRQRLARCLSALVNPYDRWLSEDYFIFHAREVPGQPTAADLIRDYARPVAQLVRGDRLPLSDGEVSEVVNSRVSYYASDLAVIGWNAAFLYDTSAGAETAIQLLEYANSQLLEFRHYDELLTGVLDGVYDMLEQKHRRFARWRLSRSANSLQTVLLEITELTERADNAIKFVSDMFAARLYRLAAARVGVPDYRNLVAQKLKTAEELYDTMVEQFNQSRGFFLEVVVVVILLIELFYLFRGHPS
jgi:hypothetical protein